MSRPLVTKTEICGEEIKLVYHACGCSTGMCNGAELFAGEEKILDIDYDEVYMAIADLISTVNNLRKKVSQLEKPVTEYQG